MQSINQLTAQITNNLSNQMPKSTETNSWQSMTHFTAQQANPQAVKVLAEMFTIWKSQYKTKMKEGAWDLLTAQIWAVALADMNMTQDEYYVSYRKSLSLEWLPTTPYDFLMLAREEIIKQYPESRVAYMEAVHRRYPHEVIYETAQRIGTWELSTKSEKETWAMWKEIYPKVCQEHASGIDFTLPVEKRLEQVQPKPATAEQADEYLDRIKKMLGGAK